MDQESNDVVVWYHSLYAKRVDLVGDYAGNELFVIELDSLLLQCFSDPKIDFDDGFQLLHAVYTVEKLLSDLAKRRCNYHIVCFDQNEDLCVPSKFAQRREKYILARYVVIRHLQRNLPNAKEKFKSFEAFTDDSFGKYLKDSGVCFAMCHDGGMMSPGVKVERTGRRTHGVGGLVTNQASLKPASGTSGSNKALQLRAMIAWFISKRYNVALVNELQFLDTKAFTVILESPSFKDRPEFSQWHAVQPSRELISITLPEELPQVEELSERDIITLLALQGPVQMGQLTSEQALSFLLHTAALHCLPLQKRSFDDPPDKTFWQLVSIFTSRSESYLRDEKFLNWLDSQSLVCDVADLLDAFLLAAILQEKNVFGIVLADEGVKTKFENLSRAFTIVSGVTLTTDVMSFVRFGKDEPKFSIGSPLSQEEHRMGALALFQPSIMPFNNPIFDAHLAPVRLVVEKDHATRAEVSNPRLFQEITHWHNHKKVIMPKGTPPKSGFFARRRNQRFMAEVQDYAASLTNAAGKVLEPETIIARPSNPPKQQKTYKHKDQPRKQIKAEQLQKNEPKASKSKSSGNSTKKGGKSAALEAAAAKQASKALTKATTNAGFWYDKCNDMSTQVDLLSRYSLAKTYLESLHAKELVPEVELYIVKCLADYCHISQTSICEKELIALIWNAHLRLAKQPVGMTPEIVAGLHIIAKSFGFSEFDIVANAPSRSLAFEVPKKKHAKSRAMCQTVFQLEHCGPYFDRAMDSAPDSRVPFEPDGWQREVLDAIDAQKSLFVVAPTSAGKTFISFYAIKTVLQTSDDAVVVYVAPTKALVNQIAAEIQARFSKSFKYPGHSVWAIHTRDYRVNNPTGCQVLVTVPHILQIMLLAPSYAQKINSWAYRVKRIIFDEIHCIGQADDGLVWEQLLLQAPCPIIALSATVGNPGEFSSWLSSTQEANGNELVTIKHSHRYSDLRKYVYVSPKEFSFAGLPELPRINKPGLDENNAFAFIHPVASLINRSGDMPNDLNLEARDCLYLWQSMAKHATLKHPMPSSLAPTQYLPAIIKKADIFKWEESLKKVLLQWVKDETSPFVQVREELDISHLARPISHDAVVTKKTNLVIETRKVDDHDLRSMILPALVDLHAQNALPAIIFNFDRRMCERLARSVLDELKHQEDLWKLHDPTWQAKMLDFERWSKEQELNRARAKKETAKKSAKQEGEEKISKLERQRDTNEADGSKWAIFDPKAPIDGFHFANNKALAPSELKDFQKQLRQRGVSEYLILALERGVAVHHAGMNRKYRFVIEMLFRKGFLRAVFATGTLALGINMPCKTVVFAGDSVFLTALNFRQCAGRAGRRGFDVLGNVVFLGIPVSKAFQLLTSRLPDLTGHFPITTSLVLRFATLLHETKNSPFAVRTINSVLSQPRLYLGSPEAKTSVLHHLRFSIEYLRRQSLLSKTGAPINFAGCVSHLYYTGNAAWAFHALLCAGYFHELCAEINVSPERVCLTLMLVLSHIFGRIQCKRSDKEFMETVVKRSPSIVMLPPMPPKAEKALRIHNDETLDTFQTYVRTYVEQHIKELDNKLPLTQMQIGSTGTIDNPAAGMIRSPFVALSGWKDEFDDITDLCRTVRSGVFLEEAVVPYLPLSGSRPLNAYLYDFYKHGSVKELERANGIRSSDVWFHLNDFSLVLATIITSLTNFMRASSEESDMMDIVGGGDAYDNEKENEKIDKVDELKRVEHYDNEDENKGEAETGNSEDSETTAVEDGQSWTTGTSLHEEGLGKVLKAFNILQAEFDSKFKKMWA